jgi:hypothetical protein
MSMGVLVFQCPATGERINSGVHTDENSLAKVRSLSVNVYCPVCKTMHLMRAGDGQVDTVVLAPVQAPLVPAYP